VIATLPLRGINNTVQQCNCINWR